MDSATLAAGGDELIWNKYRVWRWAPATDADHYVRLPDARNIPLGGPIYYLINTHEATTSPTRDVHIQDNGGTTVGILGPAHGATLDTSGAVLLLIDNSTAAGTWAVLCCGSGSWTVAATS